MTYDPVDANDDGIVESDVDNESVNTKEGLVDELGEWESIGDVPPLRVVGKSTTPAIVLQNQDDSVISGAGKANISWYSHGDATGNPEQLAAITAHPAHNHWSLYTKQDAIGQGDTAIAKRLDVPGGSPRVTPTWEGLYSIIYNHALNDSFAEFQFPDSGNAFLELQNDSDAATDVGIRLQPGGTTSGWLEYMDSSLGNQLRLFNDNLDEDAVSIGYGSNSWDFNQNQTSGVVWANSTTSNRPSNPKTGQRYFDTTIGQPIWYDGSNWVDAQGATV